MIVPDWLSLVADVASVIGLVVTFSVWFQTSALRKAFALKGRLPELSRELGNASERILDILQKPNSDEQRFEVELERLSAILKNLLPKLPRSQREPVRQLVKRCDRDRRKNLLARVAEQRQITMDQVWEIYRRTEGLVEFLKQTEKDFKWG